MFTMVTESTRRTVSAFAAVAVVGFGGLVLDQGHNGALPRGTVELGELVPVDVMQMVATELPTVVVTASRVRHDEPANARVAASVAPLLPEIVVVATRAVQVANTVASAVLDPQG